MICQRAKSNFPVFPSFLGEKLGYQKTSAPGRICFFGEHQDYLELGVIPARDYIVRDN